jgi:hypothetical protein
MTYMGIHIHRNEGPGYKLRYWALTDTGQIAANTIQEMKGLIRNLDRIAAKLDRRYTTNREFCGYLKPTYVVRFCGEWVDKADDKDGAISIIVKHRKERGN